MEDLSKPELEVLLLFRDQKLRSKRDVQKELDAQYSDLAQVAMNGLEQKGFIEVADSDSGMVFYKLTAKGEGYLQRAGVIRS